MLKRKAEMTHESKKVWDGKGELDLCKILTPEELGGRAKLFNIVTVAPGQSIGLHSHTDDSEIYFLLEGELEVTDNDTKTTMYTGRRHVHRRRRHPQCGKLHRPGGQSAGCGLSQLISQD